MAVGLFHDHDVGLVRSKPRPNVLPSRGESLPLWHAAESEDAAGHESSAMKDGVAEFPKSRVECEDGVILVAHGV